MADPDSRSEVVLMILQRGYTVASVADDDGHHYELQRNDRTIVRAIDLAEITDIIRRHALDTR